MRLADSIRLVALQISDDYADENYYARDDATKKDKRPNFGPAAWQNQSLALR
jgi:hypothetical protein